MSGIIGGISGAVSSVASGATSIFSMFFGNTRSKVGYLELDVLVTENLSLPSDVTKYPIEDGSEISDHITQGSEELNITGSISGSTSFGLSYFGDPTKLGSCRSKIIDAVDTLRKMHKERKVIKVVTGLGKYEDMAFTALSLNRGSGDKGGNWIDINASLRKIKKVKLKTADLPAEQAKGDAKGKTGKTESKTGKSGKEQYGPPEVTAPSQLYGITENPGKILSWIK